MIEESEEIIKIKIILCLLKEKELFDFIPWETSAISQEVKGLPRFSSV